MVWRIQSSVEVASCWPEPPAAGSGLEALNVVGLLALQGRLTFGIVYVGFGILDLGFWIFDFGFWILVVGFWILAFGSQMAWG